jgi:hypothetical protein
MSNFFAVIKELGKNTEKPFLVRHVESHLVFGPLSRYVPFGYVVLVAAVVSIFVGLVADHQTIGQYVGIINDNLIFLILPFNYNTIIYFLPLLLG